MTETKFAMRRREEFIELAPGQMKAWSLPPCTRGVINILLHYSGAPSGGGGGGGNEVPDPGWIARSRFPTGPVTDLELEVGGETGLAYDLNLELICGPRVVKTSDATRPGQIFFDEPNFDAAGDGFILQVTRPNDGSIGPRRYRVTVIYPSVLPVKTRPIAASFFKRGFDENWNTTPYLDYVRITNDHIAFCWEKKFALYYNKPNDDQYIPLPYSDWYNLPTIIMSSVTLSVEGDVEPWDTPDGVDKNIVPYLMFEMKCRCEGSRTVEFDTPGPNIVDFELPQDFSIKIKLFLTTVGAYSSPILSCYAVVESELLDMLDHDVPYPTLSGFETVNLKDEVKKAVENYITNLEGAFLNSFVRPYFVGQSDLYGIEWERDLGRILVSYVGEQEKLPPRLDPEGHQGGSGTVGHGPPPSPPLFHTPLEKMPPPHARFAHTVAVNPGNLSKIDHIVVLMQENRSFDNVLGYLSRDGMLPRDKLLDGDETAGRGPPQSHVDGLLPDEISRDVNSYNGVDYRSKRRKTTAWPSYAFPSPGHASDDVARQVSDGMKGFVSDWARRTSSAHYIPGPQDPDDPLEHVMAYLTDAELPTYGALTREFAICDKWHCSHLGGTLPNRFISLTGNFSRDVYGSPEIDNPDLMGFSPLKESTFFDHLTESGVDWKLFEHGYSMLRLVQKYTFDEDLIQSFSRFEEAVASGLPPVTFIEPDYIETPTGVSNDDHAPADMMNGQIFIARIMKALLANKEQWARTLFIITYDEHGGFYDHVQPPTHVETTNPDGSVTQVAIPPLSVGDPRLGVRVPAFVVSPFIPSADANGNVNISHALFDHTSIPATILRRFCGPKAPFMGERWAAANDVGHLLTLDAARPDSDFDQLREEMTAIAKIVSVRFPGDPSTIVKPPLRKPQTAKDIEEDFPGLVAFASSMTGRGA